MTDAKITMLEQAQALAEQGFHVFPLRSGGKKPAITGWPKRATTDPAQIEQWWSGRPLNIGIATERFGADQALVVVDVDNKNGKCGDETVLALELEGLDLPPTWQVLTPTGGRHLYYVVDEPVKQGAEVLGPGVDIRSRGGYVVAPGSVTEKGEYLCMNIEKITIAPAPQWLIDRCGRAPERAEVDRAMPENVDPDRARDRAVHYLEKEAPEAVEGAAGDQTTYVVACRVKDLGVVESDAVDLMLDHWNDRCQPPWAPEELATKVRNAYQYGVEPPGAAAPEAQFEPVQPQAAGEASGTGETGDAAHPFDRLNRNYAFVLTGTGHHILWETTDERGRFALRHLSETSFHKAHAAQTMTIETQKGSKAVPVTKLWMEHERRRSYKGICFMPGRDAPSDWYNLWRGFTVEPLPEGEPATDEAAWALDAWLEHARENVCQGDRALFKWLIGFFAHMIQRPWEKPLVALVFRGGKGTGKNALVDRVGALLGSHYMLSSNRRYLVGNFNGHLERLLMFALDEAFWSGDKQAEGQLKDLITGRVHVIEHKGEEPYEVDNLTRVVIIGNEDWLVPATADERRFAVFDVGDGRKQDKRFFHRMRVAMERHGGYRLLLRYLLELDISSIDVNQAPATQGLLDQKTQSLEPLQQWWLDCLLEGEVQGSDFAGGWPDSVETERLRAALRRYFRDRNVRARVPSAHEFGHQLKRVAPKVTRKRVRIDGDTLRYAYVMPDLAVCRDDWDALIGHRVPWPDDAE